MGSGLGTELGKRALFHHNLSELQEYLSRLRTNDPTLVELDLSNRFLGKEGAEFSTALIGNTHLKSINLSYNKLGGDIVSKVTECLEKNSTVEHLNLSGNHLGEEGAKLIADLLTKTQSLKELILFNCALDDKSALHLANALQSNKSLNVLCLNMNAMTDLSAEMLTKCFRHNRTLTSLSLKQNDGISEKWIREIDALLLGNQKTQTTLAEKRRIRAEKEKEKEEQARQKRAEEEEQERVEREEVEKKHAEMEEKKKKLEEEQLKVQQERDRSREERRAQREMAVQQKEQYIDTVVSNAYKWREQIIGHDDKWSSGFAVAPMEGVEDPYLPDRRLHACWCEPTDAPAGYAGKLHYHCKYEPDPADAFKGADQGQKYMGCKPVVGQCDAHRCISVGAYVSRLQKDTAATFFSSRSPMQQGGND